MRVRNMAILLAVAVTSSCTTLPVLGGAPALTTVRVASGLSRPVFVAAPAGDIHRIFVVEKAGVIKLIVDGVVQTLPFMDIRSRVGGGDSAGSEQGLLGLAFHPDFLNNGFFYVNYTNVNEDTTIARFQAFGDPATATLAKPQTEFILMTFFQPFVNHNGGWLAFGPNDGFLYIATGDGGFGGDPEDRAQDIINQRLGKMLRIDVDGGSPFAIPPDNPFVGVTGDDEIWAYGLRNPWRNSFDTLTGDLYIADVGQSLWEEINFQPGSSTGGENYGWRCKEADHCFDTSSGCTCASSFLVDPIHEYSHGGIPFRCSITGGEVYRGCSIPSLDGTYFFADFCSDQIWSFRYVGGAVTEFTNRTAELAPSSGGSIEGISSFGRDGLGEIYICTQGDLASNGQIYKIISSVNGLAGDCNGNGIPDSCDIAICTGDPACADCNENGLPDSCEPDCQANGIADECDIADCGGDPACGDCNGNAQPDFCDIASLASSDDNGNGIPDECEKQPPLAENNGSCSNDGDCVNTATCIAGVCYVAKNRYVSVSPNPITVPSTARRISVVTGSGPVVLGWMSTPTAVSVSGPPPSPKMLSRIDPVPVYRDWSAEPTIHIGDCGISSPQTYVLQAIDSGLDVAVESNYSAPLLLPTAAVWGDVGGATDAGGVTDPPDGLANFIDIFLIVTGFRNVQTASTVWLDLVGEGDPNNLPDFSLINFVDISQSVAGFQGGSYPFNDACACASLGDCP